MQTNEEHRDQEQLIILRRLNRQTYQIRRLERERWGQQCEAQIQHAPIPSVGSQASYEVEQPAHQQPTPGPQNALQNQVDTELKLN